MAPATTKPKGETKGPVVIIDDDEKFRAEINEVLTAQGYETVLLESADHALRYFERQSWAWIPWLLIVDLVMEGMGGYQFMRRVPEIFPASNIPMIVCTKLRQGEDMTEAEAAGASAYLTKPIDQEALLTAIENVSTLSRKKKALATDHDDILSDIER